MLLVRCLCWLLCCLGLLACAAPPVAPLPTAAPVPATERSTVVPPAPLADELTALAAAERLPKDRVALARAFGGGADLPAVARTEPLDIAPGEVKAFWVTDLLASTNYTVTAELRYAGPVLLLYVEQNVTVNQAALEESARTFEQEIYPRMHTLFGTEWQPGVDGDPRIVVLNVGNIGGGVIGYFSARDSVPRSVNRFSNEHEMFYMDATRVRPGSRAYLNTLTHEFQHMIHWHEQRRATTWFNEGNSTLAEDLNGLGNQSYTSAYLAAPDTQLTTWSSTPGASLAHYGAAQLFMRYIYTHYAGDEGLRTLIEADAGNHLPAFVALANRARPSLADFGDLFAEWALANLLNDATLAQGHYSYTGTAPTVLELPATVSPQRVDRGSTSGTVAPFGADYLALPPETRTLTFTGATAASLVGIPVPDGTAWWSGRGDNSMATLTRAFDLRGLERATLRFDTWYELEVGYDYGFVAVSTDDGTSWETLPAPITTRDDPHGANYGNGITGMSGAPGQDIGGEVRGTWQTVEADLTPYVGRDVLLRFWQVNDEGFNGPGWLVDTIRVPELGYTHTAKLGPDTHDGWQASGFVRVDGDLPQHWELRLVRTAADGSITVTPLTVDAQGQATAALAPGETGVLLVAATTPHTTEPATYTLEALP